MSAPGAEFLDDGQGPAAGHAVFPGMEHRPAPGWLSELRSVFLAPPATWQHRLLVLAESTYFCVPAVVLGWATGIGVDALFRLFRIGSSQALAAVAVGLQLLFSALVVIVGRALLRFIPAPTDAFREFRNGNSMIAADLIFTVCLFASQIQLADRQRRLFDSIEPTVPEPPLDVTVNVYEAAPTPTPASTPPTPPPASTPPTPPAASTPPPAREPFGMGGVRHRAVAMAAPLWTR